MVLKLYGYHIYSCTKRVATILHEKKVPFELITVDVPKGEHKTPEMLAKQPFGQTPFIDDDGFILYESRAIGRYIAEKYANQGTQLIPSDPKQRALFEQAASIETANFDTIAQPLMYATIVTKMQGGEPDQQKVEELSKSLEGKLDGYEKILANQEYLGGNEITLADLFHLPHGAVLPEAGYHGIQERANVKRWFSALESRPSWQAVKDGVKSVAKYD